MTTPTDRQLDAIVALKALDTLAKREQCNDTGSDLGHYAAVIGEYYGLQKCDRCETWQPVEGFDFLLGRFRHDVCRNCKLVEDEPSNSFDVAEARNEVFRDNVRGDFK